MEGSEKVVVVVRVDRLPIASRFAEESERSAAASDVASIPADMNEWSAIDIAGVESV